MTYRSLPAAICLVLGLQAGLAHGETFLQVYQQAREYDAQLKALETNYLATLENKPQALAAEKPQISISGGLGARQQVDIQDSDTTSTLNGTYTLGVTKSLYNRQIGARIDQVDASITQAQNQLEQQRESLATRVSTAYFDFLRAQETQRVANTETKAVQQQLFQVRAFFDAGRSAITDVREAESRTNAAIAQEVSAREAINNAREALRSLTGKSYETLSGPGKNLPLLIPTPRNIDAWLELARKNNKSLQVARAAIDLAQKQIEVQRATRSPVVNAYARHTGALTLTEYPADPINTGLNVGVEASMPLYEGGAYESRIRQAQHQFRQAQQDYDYAERQMEQQVRSAYLAVESSISQVQAQQKALVSAETAAQATQVGFEVGTRTAVDVLTALQDVFAARRNYTSARYAYLQGIVQLHQAAGTFTDAEITRFSTLMPQNVSAGGTRSASSSGGTTNARQQQQQRQAEQRRQQQQQQRLAEQRRQQLAQQRQQALQRQQQHEARLREQKRQQQAAQQRQQAAARQGQPRPQAAGNAATGNTGAAPSTASQPLQLDRQFEFRPGAL